MKLCNKCKNNKAESHYHKDKSTKDGLHPYCKACRSKDSQNRVITKAMDKSRLDDILDNLSTFRREITALKHDLYGYPEQPPLPEEFECRICGRTKPIKYFNPSGNIHSRSCFSCREFEASEQIAALKDEFDKLR